MKNQNSHFNNSNNRTNASTNNHTNNNTDNSIKNAKNVNIAHFDARVLVYVWLISFISMLFLAVCGYVVLDNKIQRQANNFNSFVVGLMGGSQNLPK